MHRPFPSADLERFLARASRVAVIDRDLSLGLGGVLWAEARALAPRAALVQGYVVGLGGGDPRPAHVEAILEDLRMREAPGEPVLLEVGT
jgi:pyruvate/2-oxoacid:ferredoxin oxidoreductase alpha subunit